MKQRHCDRVRESIEDYFVHDVPSRANCVPAHAQENNPDPFFDRGPVRRSHLSVRQVTGVSAWLRRASRLPMMAWELPV